VKRSENRSEEETKTLRRRLKTLRRVTERCCTFFEEFAGMLRDKEQRSEERARSRLEARGWRSEQSEPKHPKSPN
jgi:hypothetical protein